MPSEARQASHAKRAPFLHNGSYRDPETKSQKFKKLTPFILVFWPSFNKAVFMKIKLI